MSLQPLGPRLLVRPDDPVKTVGVIALPDKAQRNTTRGVVLAVGELVEDRVELMTHVFPLDALESLDETLSEAEVGIGCRLVSGGPEMTITRLEEGSADSPDLAECQWFDRYRIPVNVGDRVVFGEYVGVEIKESGEKLLMLTMKDVYAIERQSDNDEIPSEDATEVAINGDMQSFISDEGVYKAKLSAEDKYGRPVLIGGGSTPSVEEPGS